MAEKRQKKQAVKAFEKETFSKDKEVTGAKHTEHRQDNTFSVENQFSARENTHTESVQSQKIQSSPIMEISRQRMPHFRRGRRKNLPTEKYRRLLISQKRTAGSYRRQRTRCRKSGSMR